MQGPVQPGNLEETGGNQQRMLQGQGGPLEMFSSLLRMQELESSQVELLELQEEESRGSLPLCCSTQPVP